MPKKPSVPSANGAAHPTVSKLDDNAIRELSQTFKLLSDEARLRILVHLARSGELHVTDLCTRLQQSQPAVSHHLALLRVAGLIEPKRVGKHNYYRVNPRAFNDTLRQLLATAGPVPRRLQFEDFLVTYSGK